MQQDHARDAARRAACRGEKCIEPSAELGHHTRVGKQQSRRYIRGRAGRDFAAGVEIGKYQRRDLVAVGPGEHDVARQRGKMRNESPAQRPDADPGAGRQLEILGEPPVEQQAFGWIVRIGELQGVADPVKPLIVERRRGQLRRAPIAGRDIGAFEPGFELALARHEFEINARKRQADIAGALGLPRTGQRRRRGLGRAETRHEQNALAGGLDRKLPHRRRAHAAPSPHRHRT